jgi:hypothetical protein
VRLYYGSYAHDEAEATVTVTKTVNETEAGVPFEVVHNWVIQGRVIADTTAAVVAKLGLIERAYGTWFRDARLVAADGTVCHALVNAGSTSGVRVPNPPHYPDGSGGQLTTFRDYTIVLTATYPAFGGLGLIRSWTETLSFTGGTPVRKLMRTKNTRPVVWIDGAITPYRAVQSGQAVGVYGYPPVPPPLWGATSLEGEDPVRIDRGTPRFYRGRFMDYPVQWFYRFAATAPLIGLPTAMPNT